VTKSKSVVVKPTSGWEALEVGGLLITVLMVFL
jgi:hypothetical protein